MIVRLVRQQAIDTQIVAKIRLGRIVFGHHASFGGFQHAGHDFVAGSNWLAHAVHVNGAANFNDFARAFVSQNDGAKFERIIIETMNVCAADAAAFNAHKNFVFPNLAQGKFLQLKPFFLTSTAARARIGIAGSWLVERISGLNADDGVGEAVTTWLRVCRITSRTIFSISAGLKFMNNSSNYTNYSNNIQD